MNVSDLDCPQYVRFDSEAFLRESSGLPDGSLNVTSNDEGISETLSPIDDSKNCMESTRYNYTETSDIDQGSLRDLTNRTENFPIIHAKHSSDMAKSTVLKTTVPKPFQFQTDTRLKSKSDEVEKYEKKDFVAELRHNTTLQQNKNRITKPKPFNLTEAKKRKHEGDYLPLAEQISAFQRKTPERYHTSSNKEFQPQSRWIPAKIVAKTPKLQAFKRRRIVDTLSREEQENKEIEEMKSYEFHARPIDPKIYKLPSTLKAHPFKTKAKDFRLKSTSRAIMHLRSRTKSNSEKFEFKARPVPKAILSGPSGLKERPTVCLTKAKSPNFKTESRLEKRKIHDQEKKVQDELLQKKKPKKKKEVPSVPSIPYSKKRTEVQPFSFDKMDQERFSMKEKRIEEEIKEKNKPFVFQAQMMPCLEPSSLPAVAKLPPTEVKPFNFLLETRNFRASNLSFDANNTTFRAQPATVLKKEPFIPEKPEKQIIEFKEFNLYTDKRASDRQHLKEIKEQEELAMQEVLLEQKAIDEEKERQELIRLRREIVHKANPIRQYKPVELQPSTAPLTMPESPKFETDKRIQKRHDETASD